MKLFKTCRACETPDVTSTYREQHAVVLCAECNTDWNTSAGPVDPVAVYTGVVFPTETGVLPFVEGRTKGGQGGGR